MLEKSIFFPCAGFVLTYVESGSPFSSTIALPVSMLARQTGRPSRAARVALVDSDRQHQRDERHQDA